MNLIFNETKSDPQTHVLIIGIGTYPYLQGGHGYQSGLPIGLDGLGQLSSPEKSARAFYNLVMDLHKANNWIKPLGSVDFISTGNEDLSLDIPTMNIIRESWYKWKDRCNTNAGNTAIFYFCGHGFEKGTHILPAADFGKITHDPWLHAFDFDKSRLAFQTCEAETQVFFIDACRTIAPQLLEIDFDVRSLEPVTIRAKMKKGLLVHKATAPNENAFARLNTVSIYTQALIRLLKGEGAQNQDDTWIVETADISHKIYSIMANVDNTQGELDRCTHQGGKSAPLIRFTTPPKCSLILGCKPVEALPFAELSYYQFHPNNSSIPIKRPPDTIPWHIPLMAGIYVVEAAFMNVGYIGKKDIVTVEPPSKEKNIKCN
jgi:hypothetical protein